MIGVFEGEYCGFFVFDLLMFLLLIVSVKFDFYNFGGLDDIFVGFYLENLLEILSFFNYSGFFVVFMIGGSGFIGIFVDLGLGLFYGSMMVGVGNDG